MKKILAIIILVTAFTTVKAQQVSQYSQYLQNMYIINPAAAGYNDGWEISSAYRQQWVGIEDSPKTFYASAFGSFGKPKKRKYKYASLRYSRNKNTVVQNKLFHGAGGFISLDQAGAFKRYFGKASYAVHLPLTRQLKMSLAPSAGITRFELDRDKIDLLDPNDVTYDAYLAEGTSKTLFDLNFGMLLYSEDFFVGYSVEQLLRNEFGNEDATSDTQLSLHHFISAGYNFRLTREWTLTPSALFRKTEIAPGSYDFNVKIDYREKFWAGTSYRYDNAIVMMFGAFVTDNVKFGYSFDLATTEIQQYSSLSHEFYLGFVLGK